MNFQNITAEEFKDLKSREDHVVLDVRSPQELEEGAIAGHIQVNFYDPGFQEKISTLDRSKTYLVYCRSGARSSQACHMMSMLGFERLYNLSGGILAWNTAVI